MLQYLHQYCFFEIQYLQVSVMIIPALSIATHSAMMSCCWRKDDNEMAVGRQMSNVPVNK